MGTMRPNAGTMRGRRIFPDEEGTERQVVPDFAALGEWSQNLPR